MATNVVLDTTMVCQFFKEPLETRLTPPGLHNGRALQGARAKGTIPALQVDFVSPKLIFIADLQELRLPRPTRLLQ